MVSEASCRDRRIDVIKSLYRNAGRQDFLQRGDAIGKIRADHGNVRVTQLSPHHRENFLPAFKDPYVAIRRAGQVTIVLVPLHVMFEENNAVPATMQRLAQRAKRGGVPVAPR